MRSMNRSLERPQIWSRSWKTAQVFSTNEGWNFRIIEKWRLKDLAAKRVELLKAPRNRCKNEMGWSQSNISSKEWRKLSRQVSKRMDMFHITESYSGCYPNNSHLEETIGRFKKQIKGYKEYVFRIYHYWRVFHSKTLGVYSAVY